ncbi:MAG: hypothetical protein K6E16_06875 [Lachnospiraceae bacterium]|nr:hypothetical protein [Lachnospiraceae bacterium]
MMMQLTSLHYVFFILIVLIAYYAVSKFQYGQRIVLAASNLFLISAMTRKTVMILIVLFVTFVYFAGFLLERFVKAGEKKKAHAFFWCAILCVVAFLCYFKFFRFTYEWLQEVLALKGIGLAEFIVPIGVSYYTLTLLAYLIDIYHKKHAAEHNFLNFLVFVTFFPSIIEGPINLYRKVMPQITEPHKFSPDNFIDGFARILFGYCKKMLIADRIGMIVIGILGDETLTGWPVFFAMILYSFQIYADFSGGIDVVMGVAKMLDIQLTENFKAPLMSVSVTEFWAKWHISLGEFMEKYIYYPIVLNRRIMKLSKKIKNAYLSKAFSATIASVIVFIIVGIWHGTGWNYVVYGCYQALFVSSAVLLGPVYKKGRALLPFGESTCYRVFMILRTFVILTFGRYFIRAKDLPQAFTLFERTFAGGGFSKLTDGTLLQFGLDPLDLWIMGGGIMLMIVLDLIASRGVKIRERIIRGNIVIRYGLYFVAIFSLLIFGMYGEGFTGASFIYQGF